MSLKLTWSGNMCVTLTNVRVELKFQVPEQRAAESAQLVQEVVKKALVQEAVEQASQLQGVEQALEVEAVQEALEVEGVERGLEVEGVEQALGEQDLEVELEVWQEGLEAGGSGFQRFWLF